MLYSVEDIVRIIRRATTNVCYQTYNLLAIEVFDSKVGDNIPTIMID